MLFDTKKVKMHFVPTKWLSYASDGSFVLDTMAAGRIQHTLLASAVRRFTFLSR